MPYADLVVVVLTCVTVIITCAALVIGMLGVFGFKMIKDEAIRASILASEKRAIISSLEAIEKEMAQGGSLRSILEERANKIIAEYNRSRVPLEEWGDQSKDYGE